ncbi:MAG: polysaccharide deacetylase family protein [Anaerolineae bacterium]|nr:polysaccharide deacetylase family protein [Anaerolineae bacterium]
MKKKLLAAALYKGGVPKLLNTYWGPDRLTVLAYHRITDPTPSQFSYYIPNISCAPEMFARQMDYVAQHFNVIDLAALRDFIERGTPLPPRPLLITFDDGYLDNYTNAYPVLRQHKFPAVIFLMTRAMDDPTPPWWDACGYYFQHTLRTQANLPLVGACDLSTPALRNAARESLMRRLKQIPEGQKQEAMQMLPTALDVTPPPLEPRLFMNWDEVREIVANGVACQPHTVTHPILTRIDPAEVRRQLKESRTKIEQETGQIATTFAYPNGTLADYNADTMQALRENGYTIAVTLIPGPMRIADVKQHPLQIARIFLGNRDSFESFVMKVMGLPAVTSRLELMPEHA